VHKNDDQSGFADRGALRLVNTDASVLPLLNQPFQFSDDTYQTIPAQLPETDPRLLIAKMTQTRHECRSTGLITRDTTELIHIGRTLGLAPEHTKQIIGLVIRSLGRSITELDHTVLVEIPIDRTNKKTRMSLRVLLGLSIWAITIAVAMQMV